MTYAAGRTYLAIPGPSSSPTRCLARCIALPRHLCPANCPTWCLPGIFAADPARRRPNSGSVAAHSTSRMAWRLREAANTNAMFSRGDAVLFVFITGRSGEGFGPAMAALGVDVRAAIDFGRQRCSGQVRKALPRWR